MLPIRYLTILFLLASSLLCCKKEPETSILDNPSSYDFSAIDKVLDDSVPVEFDGRCFVMISVNGKLVYYRGYGGYTRDTRQLIASCSKWLSAAVVISLVDAGTLKLSDTVGKFLPEFTTSHKGNITLSQLLSHTSGFIGHSSEEYEYNQSLTLQQAVDSIAAHVPLLYGPGKGFFYGGVSMQVAGRICEVVTGKSWGSLFAERIALPCGMLNTDFGPTTNPLIAGGARSTPEDYLKFLNMIIAKGVNADGIRVLSEAAIDNMEKGWVGSAVTVFSPYPAGLLNTSQYYGLGNWRDLTGPGDVLIEGSSPGKFGSHPWINRDKKMAGFIFTLVSHDDNEISPTVYTCLKIRALCRSIVQ